MSAIAFVNERGQEAIAGSLGVSRQAVAKWTKNESVPGNRLDALRFLAKEQGIEIVEGELLVLTPSRVRSATDATATDATATDATKSVATATTQPAATKSAATATTQPAATKSVATATDTTASVEIARRQVVYARIYADTCADQAQGLPPVPPVPGYAWRLLGLAALDLPPIALAFMTVALVSPVVAVVSALALATFLVLGAHALGGVMRECANGVWEWVPRIISMAVMSIYLCSVVASILYLRAQGLNGDELALGTATLFSDATAPQLPETFKLAILATAALVTIGSMLFAIAWSYAHHSPQAAFARAERDFGKSLRRLEKTIEKATKKRTWWQGERAVVLGVMVVAGCMVATAQPVTAQPATCQGRDVLALIDATTSYDERDRNLIMPAMETMGLGLQPGDRLRVVTVRDDPSTSLNLFDGCVPKPGWVAWALNDPATLAAERRTFFKEVREVIEVPLYQVHDADRTALAATLAAFAPADEVWMFSDLLDSGSAEVADLLQGQLDGPTLPPMTGVIVNVAGFGRFHDKMRRDLTHAEAGAVVAAWSQYVASAGARLRILRADITEK